MSGRSASVTVMQQQDNGVEERRKKNTMAARRSRARKVEKQQDLEEQVEKLTKQVRRLESENDQYAIQNKLLKEEVEDCNARLNKMQDKLLNILNKDKS